MNASVAIQVLPNVQDEEEVIRIVVHEDIDSRHYDACYPKIYTCPILQPEVEKTDKCSDNFECLLHNQI